MRAADVPSTLRLVESGRDPAQTKHWEGAFTQGSGSLHVRGSHEEGLAAAAQDESYMRLPANVTLEKPRHPRSKWGTYVPGITGNHPLLREELVNLPFFLDLRVTADGEALDMDRSTLEGYERFLDLRDGVLYRSFAWRTAAGAVLEASYRRFVSRARARVCVQEASWRCVSGEAVLRFASGIDARVRTNGWDHFAAVTSAGEGGRASVSVTTDTGDRIAMVSEARGAGLSFAPRGRDDRRPTSEAEVCLRAGSSVRVVKISAVTTSRDPGQGAPLETTAADELAAAWSAEQRLFDENAAAWAGLWRRAAVVIEGDERAQLAVRFSEYHLLRAANPGDPRVAICAKGSAGEAYFGHCFWDSEIYLLPFYLHALPAAARALLEFRVNTLPGARRNAAAGGYRGARFPWESSVTGDEQCPNWQYADFEVHVTADIAHALRHWAAATGEPLPRGADELLAETSRFWLSRVERAPDGRVNLNGVMGPDEYTCFSNNNAYTNEMVRRALLFTLESAPGLSAAERAELASVAAGLARPPRADGIIRQCDGFEVLEDIDFAAVWTDRRRPFGHFVSQERMYRSKCLKQADALMLAYLFPSEMPREALAANYDYYEPLTTHDSSLSCVVHSLLASRLGRAPQAWSLFERALDIDTDPGHGGAAEGIHIANCGGIWQAVVLGFAGMAWSYESPVPRFEPRLPARWETISFPLAWRGRAYDVRVTKAGAEAREGTT